ncbi:hypothetical protein AB1K83_12420 [Sporosarcina sp. 179-K 3D1 HS]|uniref:hypothetical protein n=1 Tax=Sporosarcina sp. 179-K 3D1 HS TaxID=3232169 RepID=UPI0039A3C599
MNAEGMAVVLEQLGRTHNGFVSLINAHTGIGRMEHYNDTGKEEDKPARLIQEKVKNGYSGREI